MAKNKLPNLLPKNGWKITSYKYAYKLVFLNTITLANIFIKRIDKI
ncbi:hypothetical protein [Tenacibaculum soleae]